MSKGLHSDSDKAFKDSKPDIMKGLCSSTPQTMTLSVLSASISRVAKMIAETPEIHALLTTIGDWLKPILSEIFLAASPKFMIFLSFSVSWRTPTFPLVLLRTKTVRSEIISGWLVMALIIE